MQSPTPPHLQTGRNGEEAALQFLKQAGFNVLATNFRHKRAEVDIVACAPDGTLVFAEVKARSAGMLAVPEAAVSARKQALIAKAAQAFINESGLKDHYARFDVLAVSFDAVGKPEIYHIENAFHIHAPL